MAFLLAESLLLLGGTADSSLEILEGSGEIVLELQVVLPMLGETQTPDGKAGFECAWKDLVAQADLLNVRMSIVNGGLVRFCLNAEHLAEIPVDYSI